MSIYDRPEVKDACLRLQDEAGLDVDVLLALCWAACAGHRLEAPAIRRLLDATATLRAWTSTQRRHRREASARATDDPGWAPIADAALATELAAERVTLHRLYGRLAGLSLTGSTAPAEAARHSLATYAQIMGIDEGLPALAVLASAVGADPA